MNNGKDKDSVRHESGPTEEDRTPVTVWSVLQEQVEMQCSVMAACCGCTRIAVVLRANIAQTQSLGAPDV